MCRFGKYNALSACVRSMMREREDGVPYLVTILMGLREHKHHLTDIYTKSAARHSPLPLLPYMLAHLWTTSGTLLLGSETTLR